MASKQLSVSTDVKINHRLRVLISELGYKLNRTVTIKEIAEATGTAPNTISSYVNNRQSTRVSLRVLELVIEYFGKHGMSIDMNDLFEVELREEESV